MGVVIPIKGQTLNVFAVRIHDVDLGGPPAIGDESDLFPIGGPGRGDVDGWMIGEPAELRTVQLHGIDFRIAIPILAQGESQALPVGRPGRRDVQSGEVSHPAFLSGPQVFDVEVGVAGLVRGEGDLLPIGRKSG